LLPDGKLPKNLYEIFYIKKYIYIYIYIYKNYIKYNLVKITLKSHHIEIFFDKI